MSLYVTRWGNGRESYLTARWGGEFLKCGGRLCFSVSSSYMGRRLWMEGEKIKSLFIGWDWDQQRTERLHSAAVPHLDTRGRPRTEATPYRLHFSQSRLLNWVVVKNKLGPVRFSGSLPRRSVSGGNKSNKMFLLMWSLTPSSLGYFTGERSVCSYDWEEVMSGYKSKPDSWRGVCLQMISADVTNN